jgi:hypothetical protein
VTGYLQRLVTTAVRGEVGVHPIVRSWKIGAGIEEQAWMEFADQVEPHLSEGTAPAEATAPAESTAAPVATPLPGGLPPSDNRPPPAADQIRDRTAPESSPASETMTPLFGEMPAADPATPVPAARIGSIVRPPATRRPRSGPPVDHPGGPARERQIPAAPARSDPWPATARPGPAAVPPFGQEFREWAAPATPPGAEGADRGDVEIHIGRIEVTAVSPPPAAPVAKAARKSINLNEYLRNGR